MSQKTDVYIKMWYFKLASFTDLDSISHLQSISQTHLVEHYIIYT